jgi:DNA invertase Pin-like site-specific DNA recombinase
MPYVRPFLRLAIFYTAFKASTNLAHMGAFAEFERAWIKERQREGIAIAKQKGV